MRAQIMEICRVSPHDISFLPSDQDTPADVRLSDSPLFRGCPFWSSVCRLILTGVEWWRLVEGWENPGFCLSL